MEAMAIGPTSLERPQSLPPDVVYLSPRFAAPVKATTRSSSPSLPLDPAEASTARIVSNFRSPEAAALKAAVKAAANVTAAMHKYSSRAKHKFLFVRALFIPSAKHFLYIYPVK